MPTITVSTTTDEVDGSVLDGDISLRDAINEAFRDWMASVRDTHYIVGSVVGPHPFPMMVRDFHRVIGIEARQQLLEKEDRLPDAGARPPRTGVRVRVVGRRPVGGGSAGAGDRTRVMKFDCRDD